jgi:hypothetical protein
MGQISSKNRFAHITVLLGLMLVGSESAVYADTTPKCRFSDDRMEILTTAYYGYVELAQSAEQHSNEWILFTWASDGQDDDASYRLLKNTDESSAFSSAIEWLAMKSSKIQAYALVWQDSIVDMVSRIEEHGIRVNAGYKNGKAYEILIRRADNESGGIELGCAVNLLHVEMAEQE